MSNLVIGIDVETTGLDHEKDKIIEVAAVLWDWDDAKPLKIISEIIDPLPDLEHSIEIDPFITKLTGISESDTKLYGEPLTQVLDKVTDLYFQSGIYVAHNAQFDRNFLVPHSSVFESAKWIDTKIDLPIDEEIHTSKKLVHLATTHGFLNPFAHRALFDVLTMLNICSRYDFEEVKKRSESPTVTVVADVSYQSRNLAKEAGFRWNAQDRLWIKEMKEIDLEKQPPYNFPTQVSML